MRAATLSEVTAEDDHGDDVSELLDTCESNFERECLRWIRDEGFELPDRAQYTVYDDDEPVARPDFYYEREAISIGVFVDGPAPEKDYVQEDDERKRKRLGANGVPCYLGYRRGTRSRYLKQYLANLSIHPPHRCATRSMIPCLARLIHG